MTAPASALADLHRRLFRAAALLVLLSLVSGGIAAFALGGWTTAFDGHTLLGAHVAGLLGAALLFGFAVSTPHLSFNPRNTARLGAVFAASQYANWLVSSTKAFFFVHGVVPGGDVANTAVFAVLNVTVVVPMFVTCVLWVWGLGPAKNAQK